MRAWVLIALVFGLAIGCAEGESSDAPAHSADDGGVVFPDGGEREDGGEPAVEDAGTMRAITLPPVNGALDYQLGGGYEPPDGVAIVSRDRTDAIAAGLYNICYVNGFQVQPGEESDWDDDLILRDDGGEPVIDEDWDEALLDVSTDDKRARIADVIGGFIRGCADDGFDAIEIDNLDSYSRSDDRLSEDDAVAMMAAFSAVAHGEGLAIAQKNSAELLGRRAELGTDFAVSEECSRYDECGEYIDAYGSGVLMIEYRREDFDEGCAAYGASHPIVLRDLDLTTPDSGDYVYDGC